MFHLNDTDLSDRACVSQQRLVFLRHPSLSSLEMNGVWSHLHNGERVMLLTLEKILMDGFNSIM